MRLKALPFFVLMALMVTACTPSTEEMPPAPEPGEDTVMEENDDDMMIPGDEEMVDLSFRNKIVLTDVSGLGAEGEGYYGNIDGETRVYASFNVVETEEDYFYEGWLICGGEVFSTGELERFDGLYMDFFVSTELPDVCEEYVLTLEPNDGDPAPAEHIMDGVMEGVSHSESTVDWYDEMFEML